MNDQESGGGIFKWVLLAIIAIVGIVGLVSLGSIYENNEAGEILIIQAPFSGKLSVYTDPGRKWQGWGQPTHYKRSNQFDFQLAKTKGDSDSSIKVRFNDGGHAQVSGAARFDLPLDIPHLLDIHQTFGSQQALHNSLIKTVMEKSIYLTGPLMSSKESYSEKRSDLINLIEDQAVNGVFQTIPVDREVEDLITSTKKWVKVVDLKRDKTGQILRQETSPLIRFGIKLYNISINDIDYEDIVDQQITTQQKATMDVQIAITNSKKAEQDVLTAEKQGQAEATKAKWAQEVEKATAVTAAEKDKAVAETQAKQRLAVAEFDRQSAEQQKQKAILIGEGESKARQLVMQADGALSIKMNAWTQVNSYYADAIAKHVGPITPTILMGSGGTNAGSNTVAELIELLKAKTARDISLELEVPSTKKQ